jgi:hypothetical protein
MKLTGYPESTRDMHRWKTEPLAFGLFVLAAESRQRNCSIFASILGFLACLSYFAGIATV